MRTAPAAVGGRRTALLLPHDLAHSRPHSPAAGWVGVGLGGLVAVGWWWWGGVGAPDAEERLGRQRRAVQAQHEVQVLAGAPRHQHAAEAAALAVHAGGRGVEALAAVGVGGEELGVAHRGVEAAAHRERLAADRPLRLSAEPAPGRWAVAKFASGRR